MKLPNGKYEVQLTVGDPKYAAGYSINVNKVPIFLNEVLKAN